MNAFDEFVVAFGEQLAAQFARLILQVRSALPDQRLEQLPLALGDNGLELVFDDALVGSALRTISVATASLHARGQTVRSADPTHCGGRFGSHATNEIAEKRDLTGASTSRRCSIGPTIRRIARPGL